jgi:hypothetical protein
MNSKQPVLFQCVADRPLETMLLQVYSLLVFIYDVLSLIFLIMKAAIEAFYHVLFPPRQKSVGGEIVLVSNEIRSSVRTYEHL